MNEFKIGSAVKKSYDSAAAIAVVIEHSVTVIEIDLEAAATVNLDAESGPVVGDRVVFKISSDGTARDTTWGTGFTGPELSGTIDKTKVVEFVYDGSGFVQAGASVQID